MLQATVFVVEKLAPLETILPEEAKDELILFSCRLLLLIDSNICLLYLIGVCLNDHCHHKKCSDHHGEHWLKITCFHLIVARSNDYDLPASLGR